MTQRGMKSRLSEKIRSSARATLVAVRAATVMSAFDAELGSYRAAARLCGTTDKTVKQL